MQDVDMDNYKIKYEDIIFACDVFAKEGFKPCSIFEEVDAKIEEDNKSGNENQNTSPRYKPVISTEKLNLLSQEMKDAVYKIFPWFKENPCKKLSKKESLFINGVWFEYFVYSLLYTYKSILKVNDLKAGVKIKDTVGELDIVFTRNQRLHVIECKTGNHGTRQSQDYITKIIGRMAQLRALGTNPIFLTLSPHATKDKNSSTTNKDVSKLAELLRCKFVDADKLKELFDLVNSNGDAKSGAEVIEKILGIK